MPFHPDQLPDLTGKTYIVTGATSGIGYHTAARLFQHNAKVYITARTPAKAEATQTSIEALYPENHPGGARTNSRQINFLIMDLADLSSVVAAAKDFLAREPALHGLVNNAGVMASPYSLTKDGYEEQWQTNYLAHWVFTWHLLPLLRKTAAAAGHGTVRIVNLSSIAHISAPKQGIDFNDTSLRDESSVMRYGQSKLANILHAKVLNEGYGPSSSSLSGAGENGEGKIWVAAVHPGIIQTNLTQRATELPLYLRPMLTVWSWMTGGFDADKGAWSSLYCIASDAVTQEQSGGYFVPTAKLGKESDLAKDMDLAQKLERWTENEMRKSKWIE